MSMWLSSCALHWSTRTCCCIYVLADHIIYSRWYMYWNLLPWQRYPWQKYHFQGNRWHVQGNRWQQVRGDTAPVNQRQVFRCLGLRPLCRDKFAETTWNWCNNVLNCCTFAVYICSVQCGDMALCMEGCGREHCDVWRADPGWFQLDLNNWTH